MFCKILRKNIYASKFSHYFDNISFNNIICTWSDNFRVPFNHSGTSFYRGCEQEINFNLLTPLSLATYTHLTSGQFSTIDLLFGSGIFLSNGYIKVEHPMSSDHSPALYRFK